MTPEEILAECPEFVLPLDYKERRMTWSETRYFPFQVAEEDGEVIVWSRQFGDKGKVLLELAQSRKEARELKEQNARLIKTLNFYNYQDQHEMDNPGEWENRMNKVWGNKAIETIASLM